MNRVSLSVIYGAFQMSPPLTHTADTSFKFLSDGPYFVKLCLVKGWSDRGMRIASAEENEVELILQDLLNTNYALMQHINEKNFI